MVPSQYKSIYVLPTSLPYWQESVGRQLNMCASTIKDDLAALSGLQVVGFHVTWLRTGERGRRGSRCCTCSGGSRFNPTRVIQVQVSISI